MGIATAFRIMVADDNESTDTYMYFNDSTDNN